MDHITQIILILRFEDLHQLLDFYSMNNGNNAIHYTSNFGLYKVGMDLVKVQRKLKLRIKDRHENNGTSNAISCSVHSTLFIT